MNKLVSIFNITLLMTSFAVAGEKSPIYIASELYSEGKYAEALEYYSKALDQTENWFIRQDNINKHKNAPKNYHSDRSGALASIAECYLRLGEFEKAKVNINKSLESIKYLEDYEVMSRYQLYASIQTELGEYESAVEYNEKALKLARGNQSKSNIYNNMSNVYRKMGDMENAEKYAKLSLKYDESGKK